MLRRVLALGGAFLLLVVGSAPVHAEAEVEPIEYGKVGGGYAGIAGAYAWNTARDDFGDLMFDSGGVLAWLGYRIAGISSIEIVGEWQNGMKDVNGFTIMGVLNWYPVSYFEHGGRFQPFLSTGVGVISAKRPGRSTDLNGAFRLGGGIDTYVTEHWLVRLKAEWVTGVGRLSDIQYVPLSLGVQYNW